MTYVRPNFTTKKALREAIEQGKSIEVFQPGLGTVPVNGTVYLEGPHYPQPTDGILKARCRTANS